MAKIFKKKIIKVLSAAVAVVLLAAAGFLLLNKPKETKAGWWNDNWTYRRSVVVTNNAAEEHNVYISLTIDTSATSSFQADCGDLRFVKASGQSLAYYIVSGCGTANTVIHVNFDVFPAGSQTIYYYYGNPMAENGFSATDFATEASDYTIGAVGAEETGPGPVGYWTFDEGHGTTAHDESGQGNDGTITGAAWQDESMCVSGKCLYFDGSGDYVEVPDFDFK